MPLYHRRGLVPISNPRVHRLSSPNTVVRECARRHCTVIRFFALIFGHDPSRSPPAGLMRRRGDGRYRLTVRIPPTAALRRRRRRPPRTRGLAGTAPRDGTTTRDGEAGAETSAEVPVSNDTRARADR